MIKHIKKQWNDETYNLTSSACDIQIIRDLIGVIFEDNL